MNFVLSFLLVAAFLLTAVSQDVPTTIAPSTSPTTAYNVGGYSTLDPKDLEAKKAAKYAVTKSYPAVRTTIRVMTASCQVVSGWNYNMNVAVTFAANKSCAMHNYVVYKDFDTRVTQPYTLKSATPLPLLKCKGK
jgi:hypothetical protein